MNSLKKNTDRFGIILVMALIAGISGLIFSPLCDANDTTTMNDSPNLKRDRGDISSGISRLDSSNLQIGVLEHSFAHGPNTNYDHITGTAYNPTTNTYWTIDGGGEESSYIYEYREDGTIVTSGTVSLDARAIVYRPKDGNIYISSFPKNSASGAPGDIYRLNLPFNGTVALIHQGILQNRQCGFAFADGGNIFDFFDGEVREYDFATGAILKTFSLDPNFPSGNAYPYNVQIAGGGPNLYFLSSVNDVYVYDIDGNYQAVIDLNHPSFDEFDAPFSLSYANGRIYIHDNSDHMIYGYGKADACTLGIELSLSGDILKLDLNIGTLAPATVNIRLFFRNDSTLLRTEELQIIDPPVNILLQFSGFSQKAGAVILTTLTTPNEGIICSDWDIVDTGIDCNYSISPTSKTFPSNGGTRTVNITTAFDGCAWEAVSNDNWIIITSGDIGSGDGIVEYTVDPNTGTNSRTGTMTIAGQTFTVTQAGMDISPTGYISGSVQNAVTESSISGVDVTVYSDSGSASIGQGATDSSGAYLLEVPVGSGYEVTFTKTGYFSETYENVEVVEDEYTYLETVLQIDTSYSGTGSVSGTITDALSGNGVGGVEIKIRSGINVVTGNIVVTTTTVSGGTYTITDLESGNYTGEASKSGYTTTYFTVTVIGGQTNNNQDATITPILSEGETRIILTWGSTPRDLDSHLTGPIPDSDERFHVYFSDKGSSTSSPYAELDLDDTSGYGPETATIYQQFNGVYRYSVHDFTNGGSESSSALSNSSAKIEVYRGSNLITTFNVPSNQGGTLWTVFEMSGDIITPINTISYEGSPGDILRTVRSKFYRDLQIISNLPEKEQPRENSLENPREGHILINKYCPPAGYAGSGYKPEPNS